jgi:RHS repeat-associated protein
VVTSGGPCPGVATCTNNTWGACQQLPNPNNCVPGTPPESCNGETGVGTKTCNPSTCMWGSCVQGPGLAPPPPTSSPSPITGPTGSLLDDFVGLFEGTAYAQTSGGGSPATFAHHVHLTWALPVFPFYPSAVTVEPGLVGPYAFSPIWKAPPFAQLTTVDVFSATESSSDRQLVREYQLQYTPNATLTRSYLTSIQLVGDCDSIGGISEAAISASAVANCAQTEAFPATSFSYYGISAGGMNSAPTILSETEAYTPTAAADFLVDLNGDAIDDLVCGNNGAGAVTACLDQFESEGADQVCPMNTGDWIANALTFGLYDPLRSCNCPTTNSKVTGPSQSAGTPFPTTSAGSLTTYTADDSMWAFSIFADWAATGRTNFLQVLPLPPLQNLLGGGYSNTSPAPLALNQLSDPSPEAPLENLSGQISSADANFIGSVVAANDPQNCKYHLSDGSPECNGTDAAPYNAMDVDGDGLPDMGGLNSGPWTLANLQGGYWPNTTMFSTRDRNGVTHPFAAQSMHPWSRWELPSWALDLPNWGGSGGPLMLGGTYVGLTHTTSWQPLPTTTAYLQFTSAVHAGADIDGDGLADEVIVNKFRDDWNQTMYQSNRGGWNSLPNTGYNDGPFDFVGLVVLPNRGDGRFGVPGAGAYAPSPAFGSNNDWGNYVTPGATSPFMPYSYPVGGAMPPYNNVGQAPPMQSDNIDPGTPNGYSMQGSVIRFGDLNGDDMADYAVLDAYGLHICLRYGGPWDAAHWRCTTEPAYIGNNQADVTQPHATIMIGDINGSGINRVIYFPAPTTPLGTPAGGATAFLMSPDGSTTNSSTSSPRDGLLQTISNGLGAQTTYAYATINSLGIGHIPVPAWVVTSATTTNGLTGTQAVQRTTQYSYGEPIYDPRAQMFVGFRSVTATTSSAGPSSPGLVTKTTFATQTDNTCAGLICAGVAEAMIHASRYLPAVVETSENGGGRRFTTTVFSYAYQNAYTALDGAITGESQPARPGMTLTQRTTLTYPWKLGESGVSQDMAPTLTFMDPPAALGQLSVDGQFMIPSSVIKHQISYDLNTGNQVLAQDFGVPVSDVPIITLSNWELPPGDTTGWDYRVKQTLTGYAAPSDPTGSTLDTSKPYAERDYAYDSAGRVLTVSSPLTGGVQLPGPSGGAFAAGQPPTAVTSASSLTLQSFQYDQFGNVWQVGNQDYPCMATVGYDTLFSQLPETLTAFPNGCGNPGGLVTNLTFDRRLDAEKSSMDPSGSLTMRSYDDFGRVAEVDKPALDMPGATTKVLTAQYTDSPLVHLVHYRTGYGQDNSGTTAPGYLDHYRYIDGLGETRAMVDAVDPTAYTAALSSNGAATQWVISGVHTSYTNGRVATTYRQFASTSGPAAAGSLPPEVTSPRGASASRSYDGLGRVVQQTDYLGLASSTTYFDGDFATRYVDPQQATDGSSKTVLTDGHGRVTSTNLFLANGPTGSSGSLITYLTYQATGEVQSVTQQSPIGSYSRTMVYDSLGRLVQNTEPNVGTWTYAYDAEGHLVGAADARGCGQNTFYDALGRVLARDYSPCTDTQDAYSAISGVGGSTFPYPGAEVSYSYDSAGRPLAVADRARSDSYSYHSAGALQQVVRELAGPDNGGPPVYGPPHTKSYDSYTVDGKLVHSTLASSALANPAGSAVTETTTYATSGELSQVTSSLSGSIISSQQFYGDGSLGITTFGDAAATEAIAAYDANGTLSQYAIARLTAGPWVTNYAPGFPVPASNDPSVIQDLTYLGFARDNVGNPTSIYDYASAGWPPGAQATSITASYYSDYRLQNVSVSPTDSYTSPFAYEASIGSDEYPQPTPPSTNARLQNLSMSYDWRGNVTLSGDDASDFFDRSLGTVTSSADRLTSATGATATDTLTTQYDAAGNLTQILVTGASSTESEYDYWWDEVGNLAGASRGLGGGPSSDLSETYQYTDDGQRVIASSQVSGGFIMGLAPKYTVNVFDSQVLKDAYYDYTVGDYTDSLSTEQVYSAGGLARVFGDSTSAMPQLTGTKYAAPSIHTFLNLRSYNGSGAFVVDQDTSELVERTAYMPFGALDADWRPLRWQGSREDIKYTGHWDEAQVGLVYMGARYYSPQLGRFISPDPLTIHGRGGDPNPYEYANGNPFTYTDPTGLLGNCSDNGGCPPPSTDEEWTPEPATFDNWQLPPTDTTALAQNTLAGLGNGNAGGGGIQVGGCGEGAPCVADWGDDVSADLGSPNIPSWMKVTDMSGATSSFLDEVETSNETASPGQEENDSAEQLASKIDARNQAQRDAYIQDLLTTNVTVTILGGFGSIFGAPMSRGVENIRTFDSLVDARAAARQMAGLGEEDTAKYVSQVGPMKGQVVGSSSSDGLRGWRIDFDAAKGYHVNWWNKTPDFTQRSAWYYGANIIRGGTLSDFLQFLQHLQ